MSEFRRFNQRLRKISTLLGRNTEGMVREAVSTFVEVAVAATPVSSGRARSNWRVGIGAPLLTNEPPPVEGDAEAASQIALTRSRAAIASWRLTDGPLFVSNGVPYIGELDAGSSLRAPEGMTTLATVAALARINKARVLRGIR